MIHFAKVENGIVTNIIVATQDYIDSLINKDLYVLAFSRDGDIYTMDKVNYPFIGGIYDKTNNVFYNKQPYPSWTLNKSTWTWEPHVPLPKDNKPWVWNESSLKWDPIP